VETVRIGVVGLGRMGRHHARCAGLASGVELGMTCDIDPARAPEGLPFTTSLDELLEACEAVVLAVPTDRHEELGCAVLASGRHLLVEKPLAGTAASCRVLERAAGEAQRVLAVGHVERWNGAWNSIREKIRRPRFVEAHRLAGFDPRGTEVDVVLDLMVHDLDLAIAMFGAEPDHVEGVGVAVLTDRVDIAHARLEFPGGGVANLTASRVSREPVRKIRLFQQDSYFSLDLGVGTVEEFARDPEAPLGVTRTEHAAPEGHNPLVREIEEFARAVRGEKNGSIDGPGARRVVAVAERVLQSIAERRATWAEPA